MKTIPWGGEKNQVNWITQVQMAPFQLSRHHPIFQSEQLLNYLENSWNVFQFDSCRAKKHAAM